MAEWSRRVAFTVNLDDQYRVRTAQAALFFFFFLTPNKIDKTCGLECS